MQTVGGNMLPWSVISHMGLKSLALMQKDVGKRPHGELLLSTIMHGQQSSMTCSIAMKAVE